MRNMYDNAFYDLYTQKIDLEIDQDLLSDPDGNLLAKLDDKSAIDLQTGDIHLIAPLDFEHPDPGIPDFSDPPLFDFDSSDFF